MNIEIKKCLKSKRTFSVKGRDIYLKTYILLMIRESNKIIDGEGQE